jgi:hypothetical protein
MDAFQPVWSTMTSAPGDRQRLRITRRRSSTSNARNALRSSSGEPMTDYPTDFVRNRSLSRARRDHKSFLLAAAITAVVMSATPMYLLWQGEGLSAGIIGIISAVVTSRCPRWLEICLSRRTEHRRRRSASPAATSPILEARAGSTSVRRAAWSEISRGGRTHSLTARAITLRRLSRSYSGLC